MTKYETEDGKIGRILDVLDETLSTADPEYITGLKYQLDARRQKWFRQVPSEFMKGLMDIVDGLHKEDEELEKQLGREKLDAMRNPQFVKPVKS